VVVLGATDGLGDAPARGFTHGWVGGDRAASVAMWSEDLLALRRALA
jgi:hypothetical protein